MPKNFRPPGTFKSRQWHYTYKTSSTGPDGQPVNILHDFYIPVLKRSVAYDRVAGYFRSSSLAAASQGFSAFTEACGKMRLIVGADMAPDDVTAILEGDKDRLAERLNSELEDTGGWPEDVKNGVSLLSWMVSHKCLQVRVGFRVHKQTGDPLPFDARDDGYVHEKWGIFTDTEGNRLYMSGSLNESRQALVHNAENINVHADWWSRVDYQRIEEAASSFEYLWNNQNPHIRVLTLPEAVEQKMLQIASGIRHPKEIDGSSARPPEIDPPSALERLKFALIKDGPKLPGGRYVGMETAPVKPWPHQEVVAQRLIQTWLYSYLLCDEVGLGKTIEAGLAIRSLYLSGLVNRVLIAPPASLTQQWHREMASKFFLPFARIRGGSTPKQEYIFPEEETLFGDKMYEPDLCLVSTGLLSRPQRLNELQQAKKFDIALVDEAHYARRRDPKNGERRWPQFGHLYRAIRDYLTKKTECLWLATATPMQLNWIEVFDLIHLTSRVAHFQQDPTLTWGYYRALGKLIREQDLTDQEWEFLRNAVASVKDYDPFLWSFFDEAVIDGQIRPAARQWFEHGRIPRGTDRKNIRRLIFAAAPLSRVMLRHTRPLLEIYRKNGQLGANLARREIMAVPQITLKGVEKTAYDDLEAYCKELTKQLEANNPGNKWITSLGFYLSFLRLRLASSLYALRETLKRRKERVMATREYMVPSDTNDDELERRESLFGDFEEIDEKVVETLLKNRGPDDLAWEENRLSEILAPLADLTQMPLKMNELLSVLQNRRLSGGRIRQTVIFTRFYDTLTDIVSRLRKKDPSMLIGTYSGKGGQYVDPQSNQLRGVDRDEIKHRFFKEEIDVLVCTDAAAEGLNLQSADLIINYDLPWNPMKVEQRIGRIDRIGQKNEQVKVLNLCYVDSAEQIVYDRLLKRLAQAGDVVGTQQISMLPVTEDEFADLAAGTLREQTLLKRAEERIKLQKQRTESMEIPARDLYNIYLRLKDKREKNKPPVTLENIWDALVNSKYLRDLGGTVSPDNKLFNLRGIAEIPDNTEMTVDQNLYENGTPEVDQPIHFASYGEPFFEQIKDAFNQFDLPQCVVRLKEAVPDTQAEIAAYAAAIINEDGHSEIRLITAYSDVSDLLLDEERTLTPDELSAQEQELHQLMRDEFDPTRKIEQLIQNNERAGNAHAALNLLVADSLFPGINDSEHDNFWQTVKNKDEVVENRDQLIVPNIPTSALSKIQKDLLFNVQVPRTGEKTSPTLPIILVESAINTACRIADSMRERRNDLTIAKFKGRLKREIEKYTK